MAGVELAVQHGMAGTPYYKVWQAIIQRCTNPSDPNYSRYGGRGIQVCERWRDFRNFYADMGERPEGMTLERKNNDGNYESDNCCWASRSQQMYNTGRSHGPRAKCHPDRPHQARGLCRPCYRKEMG